MSAPVEARDVASERARLGLGAAPFVLWGAWLISRGDVRWEVLALMALAPSLVLVSDTSRRLFRALLPVGLVALLYDAMRLVKHVGVTVERVHVCDLRAIEMSLFSVTVDGRAGTVHDWIQLHPSRLFDALFAVPYGTYIYSVLAMAVFLYPRDFERMQRFTWTFLALNVAGFITYKVYPAAPPWYFHTHGCAVDLSTTPSEGPSLARVDQMLGFPYFHGLYGRSSNVFGAVPSLHVTYPSLLALEGWKHLRLPLRALAATYAALMIVGAVYLDHHWIVDVLLGLAYTLVIRALVVRIFAWQRARRPRATA